MENWGKRMIKKVISILLSLIIVITHLGNETISVIAEGFKITNDSIHTEINQNNNEITFNMKEENIELKVDEYKALNYEIKSKEKIKLDWVSTDKSIAIVENGLVQGLKSGKTNIKVYSNSILLDECEVIVKDEGVISSKSSVDIISLNLGVAYQIKNTSKDSILIRNTSNCETDMIYYSNDNKVGSFNRGKGLSLSLSPGESVKVKVTNVNGEGISGTFNTVDKGKYSISSIAELDLFNEVKFSNGSYKIRNNEKSAIYIGNSGEATTDGYHEKTDKFWGETEICDFIYDSYYIGSIQSGDSVVLSSSTSGTVNLFYPKEYDLTFEYSSKPAVEKIVIENDMIYNIPDHHEFTYEFFTPRYNYNPIDYKMEYISYFYFYGKLDTIGAGYTNNNRVYPSYSTDQTLGSSIDYKKIYGEELTMVLPYSNKDLVKIREEKRQLLTQIDLSSDSHFIIKNNTSVYLSFGLSNDRSINMIEYNQEGEIESCISEDASLNEQSIGISPYGKIKISSNVNGNDYILIPSEGFTIEEVETPLWGNMDIVVNESIKIKNNTDDVTAISGSGSTDRENKYKYKIYASNGKLITEETSMYGFSVYDILPNQTIEVTLLEGDSETLCMEYSLLPEEVLNESVYATLDGPENLKFDNGKYSPNPFEVTSIIKNNKVVEAKNVKVKLELDPGLVLVDGMQEQDLGDIQPNSNEISLSWKVEVDKNLHCGYDRNLSYGIRVTGEGMKENIIEKYVFIPKNPDITESNDSFEPQNDNRSGAGQIKNTSYYSWKDTYSTIYRPGDVDWWKFDVKEEEGRLLILMDSPKEKNYDIGLYNEIGNLIGTDISHYPRSVIRYNLSKSGTYYLKIYGNDNDNWSDSEKYRIHIKQDSIADSNDQIGSEKAGWDHIPHSPGEEVHYKFGGPLKVHIDNDLKNVNFRKYVSMYTLVERGIDLWNDETNSIPNKPSSLTKLIDIVPSDKQHYLSIEGYEDPATSTLGSWYYSNKKISLNIPNLIKFCSQLGTASFWGTASSFGKGVIAHELGHAMGLRDLYMSGQRGIDNRDKLMFGYINAWTHIGKVHSKDKLGLSFVQNWSKLKNVNKQSTNVIPKNNTINASYYGYNETELHQESSVIVKGTVRRTSSINEEGKIPKTKVELEIDKFYKNDKSNNEREIINFYHDGNQEMMVDKHYPLIEGDEVIVYLKSTDDGEYYIIGGTQGRFDIYEGDDDEILVMNHLEYNLQNEYEITENDDTVIFEPIKLSDFEAEIVETLENLPAAIYYNIPQMDNEYEWYNEDVTIEFSAKDDLYGIKEVSEDIILTKEGKNQSVEGYAINGKGLKSKIKVENINIDKTKPEIEFSVPSNLNSGDKLKLNCKVIDNLSGVDNVEIYVNGKAYNLNDEITLSTGKYNLEIKAHDKASNTSSQIINFNVSSNILGGGIEEPPVVVNPIEFTDIKGHWAEKTIEAFVKKGYINGYEDNTFRPNNSMTRAEFVKVVNKVFGYSQKGKENFTDVNEKDWFYEEICIGVKVGYIKGKSKDIFAPNDNITRQEVAMILTNIMKNKDENIDKLNTFKVGNQTSQLAQSSVEGAIEAGYINGYEDKTIKANGNITRAEAVSMLSRVKK